MTDCGQATSIPSSASIWLLPHVTVPSAPELPWFASRAQQSSPLPSCTWHSPSLAQQQLHPSYARLGRRSLAHPIRQQPVKPVVLKMREIPYLVGNKRLRHESHVPSLVRSRGAQRPEGHPTGQLATDTAVICPTPRHAVARDVHVSMRSCR